MTSSTGDVPTRIFLCYRHDETAYPAAWLFDRLADRFGREQVFKDIENIEPGDDFVEAIATAVGSCDVLLVLVGSQWLTAKGPDGRRRLDDPDDFVRLEIEAAIERNVRVIPLLVDGARMPRADELPASLAKLARRQAQELSSTRFGTDTQRLLSVLDRAIAGGERRAHELEAETPAGEKQPALDLGTSDPDRTVPAEFTAPLATTAGADHTFTFRGVNGDTVRVRAAVGHDETDAPEFLTARMIQLPDGTELRQLRVADTGRRSGYERLDNEILAGLRLREAARRFSGSSAEASRLYGYEASSPDPFALLESYRGEPLYRAVRQMTDDEQEAFQVSLLTGLCWLEAAGIAHRGLSPRTVRWDGRTQKALITDFSLCTVFGAPREAIGPPEWVGPEQRPGGMVFGLVTNHDDMHSAARLIFYARSRGEELSSIGQLAEAGCEELRPIFSHPDRRPTARELLAIRPGTGGALPSPPTINPALEAGRKRFNAVRASKHPGIPAVTGPDGEQVEGNSSGPTGKPPSEAIAPTGPATPQGTETARNKRRGRRPGWWFPPPASLIAAGLAVLRAVIVTSLAARTRR